MDSNNNISIEERSKIYELCKQYISGNWEQITPNELTIKPITYVLYSISFELNIKM